MGTRLPEIITEPGVECAFCPESGQPFLGGPTPKNPRMSFTNFSQGALWLAAYEDELTTEQELLQNGAGCGWFTTTDNFTWEWSYLIGFPQIRILLTAPPNSLAFAHVPGVLCLVEYANLLVAPAGVIAFDGQANLNW